ncbi:4-deoxy-L-threo-5-hexosulose-uronate ketol-isomerase [Flavobacterium sp. CECT 9288]|jgi:4-deoxy-L-threo-5-hexosulose-uronate ketol-isomerase|uniref:5-dehydro-4-deoxy-D-glucuronate isomerase n=1 Tax=unclassified Flavobacterium TaxID=196869 RepID=UPI000A3B397A|nr:MULTISPECIES: 5-dehydro-4-deoxy-D-glucuronate isomerase [unclassified Flavobacterium]OUD34958.1 5-dehydro-4-deoxy-D-glucuronate isomerase [Flavobacterium sp. FPG59]CAH0335525.1 4-deoxy-L-threo-5-hexosulose-uronate ketol-isomerase [Flavobacterium sp. CECT 9288]
MTNFSFRYATNPTDFKKYGTDELREQFLIENIFVPDEIQLTYSMYDRYVVGGVMPVKSSLKLETIPYLKSENFLDRRELGIINVGGAGVVTVDGVVYELNTKEALYVGQGCKEVLFANADGQQALFYINSAPAHTSYPTKKIGREDAEIIPLGDEITANKRILNKLIVNSIVQTCQLQMGLTELLPGNVWNTMPAHTHDRRMEAYFYFDIQAPQTVCHFMGEPQNTRHLFMQNHQAVLSPEWSIHSGAGTSNYSFIWGMAGENLDYGDMDIVAPNELR